MTDTVWVAIITGAVSLLLVFANAWAKRLSRSTKEAPTTAAIDDNSINDLTRSTRTLGEHLHDDTRALIRRSTAELHERFDALDRHRREDMEEWRAVMKPTAFGGLVDRLDKAAPNG